MHRLNSLNSYLSRFYFNLFLDIEHITFKFYVQIKGIWNSLGTLCEKQNNKTYGTNYQVILQIWNI
jgi:hypothetical protein